MDKHYERTWIRGESEVIDFAKQLADKIYNEQDKDTFRLHLVLFGQLAFEKGRTYQLKNDLITQKKGE